MITFEKKALISESENITLDELADVRFIEKHFHDFFEFVYIKSGAGVHRIQDVSYGVSQGDLLFISCNQSHSYESENGMRMVNILINPAFISSELMDAENIAELFCHSMFAEFQPDALSLKQCVHFQGNEHKDVEILIDLLLREYEEKRPGYQSILQGGIRILFSKILRALYQDYYFKTDTSHLFFRDVFHYINENYHRKIALSEIAAQHFYNPVYFGKLLKEYCGKSFTSYLKEIRISQAAYLLETTDLPISDIMEKVGYHDKKLFYAHFKKIYQKTPGKYRITGL